MSEQGQPPLKDIGIGLYSKHIKTSEHLLMCLKPECKKGRTQVKFGHHNKFPWAIYICCLSCEHTWLVCKDCYDTKKQFTEIVQLCHHNQRYHSTVCEATIEDGPPVFDDNPSEEEEANEIVVEGTLGAPQNPNTEAITWTSSQIKSHIAASFSQYNSSMYFTSIE
jgi:hypothetical protein